MDRLFVVDGNWYCHRAYHTIKSNRPMEEVLPYHIMSMVCKDALAVGAKYLLFAVDGDDIFRYKVYPEYKANRERQKEKNKEKERQKAGRGDRKGDDADQAKVDSLYQYLPAIFTAFAQAGIPFYQPSKYEADDVLCSAAHHYAIAPKKRDKIRVIGGTQDKDSYQWMTEWSWAYDSSAKGPDGKPRPRYIKPENAKLAKGVDIDQMVEYQVLIGDGIDNINGLKGYGPKTAAAILAKYGTIREWYKQADQDTRAFLSANQDLLIRNRKLVTLAKDVLPSGDLDDLKPKKVKVRREFPSSYHEYMNFLYPRSKGLFG